MIIDHSLVTTLSTHDYSRLHALKTTLTSSRHEMAGLVRRKLTSAIVMLPTDIPSHTASSGKRVRFRVDGGVSLERQLAWQGGDSSKVISCSEPLGLALLGLAPSQTLPFTDESGRTRRVTLEDVSFASAAGKDAADLACAGTAPASDRPNFSQRLGRRMAKWLQGRARTALAGLNDSLLSDIGMKRSELDSIAEALLAPNGAFQPRERK